MPGVGGGPIRSVMYGAGFVVALRALASRTVAAVRHGSFVRPVPCQPEPFGEVRSDLGAGEVAGGGDLPEEAAAVDGLGVAGGGVGGDVHDDGVDVELRFEVAVRQVHVRRSPHPIGGVFAPRSRRTARPWSSRCDTPACTPCRSASSMTARCSVSA